MTTRCESRGYLAWLCLRLRQAWWRSRRAWRHSVFHAVKPTCSAGTTNTKPTPPRCPPFPSISTRSPIASISSSSMQVAMRTSHCGRHRLELEDAANISHPVFWNQVNGDWRYRTMFENVPLPLDWPVYVSHAEASAYARWAGKELPTEAQWHRAAYGTPEGPERQYPWGAEAPNRRLGNFDFESWDPTPVGAFPQGQSAFGVADLIGNGWEWTATPFGPFPGFQPFSFYPGYSANFFDGQHYVMKGGVPARRRPCFGGPSAIGSSRITSTSMRDFAA